MYYLQSRYYDPEIGRFVNSDDAGILRILNEASFSVDLFCYCANSPTSSFDSNGFWVQRLVCGVIGAALFGGVAYAICSLFNVNKKTKTIVTIAFSVIGGILGAVFGPSLLGKVVPKLIKAINTLKKNTKIYKTNKKGMLLGVTCFDVIGMFFYYKDVITQWDAYMLSFAVEVKIAGRWTIIYYYDLLAFAYDYNKRKAISN